MADVATSGADNTCDVKGDSPEITYLTNTTPDTMTPVERRFPERAVVYVYLERLTRRETHKRKNGQSQLEYGESRSPGLYFCPISNPSTERFIPISDGSQHRGFCVHARDRVSTGNSYPERLLLLHLTELVLSRT